MNNILIRRFGRALLITMCKLIKHMLKPQPPTTRKSLWICILTWTGHRESAQRKQGPGRTGVSNPEKDADSRRPIWAQLRKAIILSL